MSWRQESDRFFVYVLGGKKTQIKHDDTEQYERISEKKALACFLFWLLLDCLRVYAVEKSHYVHCFHVPLPVNISLFSSDPLSVSECYMGFCPLTTLFLSQVSRYNCILFLLEKMSNHSVFRFMTLQIMFWDAGLCVLWWKCFPEVKLVCLFEWIWGTFFFLHLEMNDGWWA